MSGATKTKPAGEAGYMQEALYRENNISQNLHVINSAIVKTRTRLHLSIGEWQNFCVFCARLALDSAPPEIRQLFLGKPSAISKDALLLAEVFTTLVIRAEDAATATNTTYRYSDLWARALEVQRGLG
jgi:hypothetical protein